MLSKPGLVTTRGATQVAVLLTLGACQRSNVDALSSSTASNPLPLPSQEATRTSEASPTINVAFTGGTAPPFFTQPARLGLELTELEERWNRVAKIDVMPEAHNWERTEAGLMGGSAKARLVNGIELSALLLGRTSQIMQIGLEIDLQTADRAQVASAIHAFVSALNSTGEVSRVLAGLGFLGGTPIPNGTRFVDGQRRYEITYSRLDPSEGVTIGNKTFPGKLGPIKESVLLKAAPAEEAIAPTLEFAFRIASGQAPGFGKMAGFLLYSADNSDGKSLEGAFAACHAQGLELCTEPQWRRACSELPALKGVATWTSSLTEAHDALLVRGGGKSCDSGTRTTSTGGVTGRLGLCCSHAVPFVDGAKSLMDAILLKPLEQALNTRSSQELLKLLRDNLAGYGNRSDVPRDFVVHDTMGIWQKEPSAWLVYQQCRNNPDAPDSFVVDCDGVTFSQWRAVAMRWTIGMDADHKIAYLNGVRRGSISGRFIGAAPQREGSFDPHRWSIASAGGVVAENDAQFRQIGDDRNAAFSEGRLHTGSPSLPDAPPTQLAMNVEAATSTATAAEQMQNAYNKVRGSLATNPAAIAKLELAQSYWEAYRDAHALERFPHYLEDPMAYGSVFPSCMAAERERVTLTRTRDLGRGNPCTGNIANDQAEAAARNADIGLNEAYRKVRSIYADDQAFLGAFKGAELAWLKFRPAQIELAQTETGGPNPTCAAMEFEHLTQARTDEIRQWLNPPEEGDLCRGSFGPPR